jgi:hypothetical protein
VDVDGRSSPTKRAADSPGRDDTSMPGGKAIDAWNGVDSGTQLPTRDAFSGAVNHVSPSDQSLPKLGLSTPETTTGVNESFDSWQLAEGLSDADTKPDKKRRWRIDGDSAVYAK